jgi:hypothetical protein
MLQKSYTDFLTQQMREKKEKQLRNLHMRRIDQEFNINELQVITNILLYQVGI